MRPGVYGRQSVLDKEGNLVGINIGFNFFSEHENGTEGLVFNLNNDHSGIVNRICKKGRTEIGPLHMIKYNRELQREINQIAKWKNTPYKNLVLLPSTQYTYKNIEIRNSNIANKYDTFLLQDGEYELLLLHTFMEGMRLKEKLGKRRIFSEEDLFYMPDYNDSIQNNIGYQLNKHIVAQIKEPEVHLAGSWDGTHGVLIIYKKDKNNSNNSLEKLIKALEKGNLAITDYEGRMFKLKGCSLIDLEAAYKPRI